MRAWILALLVGGLTSAAQGQPCCGDCNGDLSVTINELVTEVGYVLSGCPGTPRSAPSPPHLHHGAYTRTTAPRDVG